MSDYELNWPPAYSSPPLQADFRHNAADFQVDEHLGFTPTGSGEHQLLHIRKTNQNTLWVAEQIARFAGVGIRDVGFCGRKDRWATTTQWFSVYGPKSPNIEWSALNQEGITLLNQIQHQQKLRLGMHANNSFTICLKHVRNQLDHPPSADQKERLQLLLTEIPHHGVPNYFGPQRFGRAGNNLSKVEDWFSNNIAPPRKQRSIILSSARSYLFNLVLAERVRQRNWSTRLPGERPSNGEHPTGPLWGRGRELPTQQVLELERSCLDPFQQWCHRLEHLGLQQERRSLVLFPQQLRSTWQHNDLTISFSLPPGTFATAVLAELIPVLNQPR